MKPAKFTTVQRLSLAAICVAYVLVRFWDLTASCLWFDEIFSVHAAEHAWGDLFRFVAQDLIHPPLFYAVLKIWIGIGGESVYWLRLLPVTLSVLALAPFLFLCRELKLRFSSTAVALSLFAANGALIKYAQEVRMYSLLLFLSLVSVWLFSRFYFRGKNIWILTLVNILLAYTHYFGWLVIASEIAAILIFQRIKIRHVLVMFSIVLVAYLPWMLMIWRAWSEGADVEQNIGWIGRPMLGSLIDFALDAVEPFYYQQSSADPTSIFYISVPLLLLIAVAKFFYLYRLRDAEDKSTFYLLFIFASLPIALAFLLSWVLPVSVWGSRHLIAVFPVISILAAAFITDIPAKILRWLGVTLVVVLIAASFIVRAMTEPKVYIWCAWEQLVPAAAGGEKVYVFEDLTAYHMWFTTRHQNGPQIIKVNNMPDMMEDKAYFLPRGFDGVQTINADEIARDEFWVAFRDTKWNEKHPPLNFLINKGYKVGQPQTIEAAQGMKAFLVEVSK